MKFILQFLFMTVWGGTQSFAQSADIASGTITGGGVKGYLCKKSGVKKVYLADLIEAQTVYKKDHLKFSNDPKLETPKGSFDEELRAVASKLIDIETPYKFRSELKDPEKLKTGIEKFYQFLKGEMDKAEFIELPYKLRDTNDADLPLDIKGCKIVQIANYYDDESGKLMIQKDYWDLMDPQHQVATLVHELSYKLDRTENALMNSKHTRKLVAFLFMNGRFPRSYDGLDTISEKIYCDGSDAVSHHIYSLFIYKDPAHDNGSVLDLQEFPEPVWSKTVSIHDDQGRLYEVLSQSTPGLAVGTWNGLEFTSLFRNFDNIDFKFNVQSGMPAQIELIIHTMGSQKTLSIPMVCKKYVE